MTWPPKSPSGWSNVEPGLAAFMSAGQRGVALSGLVTATTSGQQLAIAPARPGPVSPLRAGRIGVALILVQRELLASTHGYWWRGGGQLQPNQTWVAGQRTGGADGRASAWPLTARAAVTPPSTGTSAVSAKYCVIAASAATGS
jgi:hypothetical protein